MRNVLPEEILTMLRDRYLAGVADAEATFTQNSADEDAVTGALGQALATPRPLRLSVESTEYIINISYLKLRGRGACAPEKRYGSDGLFQIVVATEQVKLVQKGLPFQSKINWRGRNAALLEQAQLMEQETPGGVVVDYSVTGYKACPAYAVVAANGSRSVVDRLHPTRPLGQILGKDFLNCILGTLGLFFDPKTEEFAVASEKNSIPASLITTAVTIFNQKPPAAIGPNTAAVMSAREAQRQEALNSPSWPL
jgi:hypothetical protein